MKQEECRPGLGKVCRSGQQEACRSGQQEAGRGSRRQAGGHALESVSVSAGGRALPMPARRPWLPAAVFVCPARRRGGGREPDQPDQAASPPARKAGQAAGTDAAGRGGAGH